MSEVDVTDGVATIYFSHAYVHKSKGTAGRDPGTGWSQEARLVLFDATVSQPLPALPAAICDGYLEVGGIRHELLPLPFKRKVGAALHLEFAEGACIEVLGQRPFVELLGTPIFLEDYP